MEIPKILELRHFSLFIKEIYHLTPVFPSGIRFYGTDYGPTDVWLNNNGNLTFGGGSSTFTPDYITGAIGEPRIIAAWYADVDTRAPLEHVNETWMGTMQDNQVYYHYDAAAGVFTATWNAVGYYSQRNDKLNSFQIRLIRVGSGKEFDMEFRYNQLQWTTGEASGGVNGLGGIVVRAGYSAANATNFFELPQSGNQAAMLALTSTPGNTGEPGLWRFEVRKPVVAITPASGAVNATALTLGFSVLASADASGFTAAGITVSNGVKGALSGPVVSGGRKYFTLPVTGLVEGPLVISVAAHLVQSDFLDWNDASSATVAIDRTNPPKPSVPVVGGSPPQLSGTAEANATVHIWLNGVEVGTTTADGAGLWTYTPSSLATATYTVTVTATDAAGNASVASDASSFAYTAPAGDKKSCGGGIAGLLLLAGAALGLRRRRRA